MPAISINQSDHSEIDAGTQVQSYVSNHLPFH